MNNAPYVFLHIPKTGGTTIRSAIKRLYGVQSLKVVASSRWSQNTKNARAFLADPDPEVAVLAGHMSVNAFWPDMPTRGTFTMLRHPVDRLISGYHYFLDKKKKGLNPRLHGETSLTPEQTIIKADANVIVRFLSIGYSYTEPTRTDLETAKQHLAETFTVFGIQDYFDESLILFQRAFGWRMPLYSQRYKYSRGRDRRISADLLALGEEYHPLDMELYAFAKDLFKQRIAAQPPSFTAHLWAYRGIKRAYSIWKRSTT